MTTERMKIGFVRRGFSASGGAESYLKRLARGLVDAGHAAELWTTPDWPENEWRFGALQHLPGSSAVAFADAVEQRRAAGKCNVLMSLERVWRCDIFRAGDGVHRAWLRRRAEASSPVRNFIRAFSGKHREILRLEASLLGQKNAGRVIANSELVKREIMECYGYPADRIDVVYNGVPLAEFRHDPDARHRQRAALGLANDQTAVLFVGSGWERKGLRFAIEAVETVSDRNLILLVAGRGHESKFSSPRAKFLGPVKNLPELFSAADIFLLPTVYDPFSNACLEALAAGLPVITTRANGCSEIIDDGSHGSIIDRPQNICAIEAALLFWSEAGRGEKSRAAIVERAAKFDISRNVARTQALLLQACANAEATSGKIRKT